MYQGEALVAKVADLKTIVINRGLEHGLEPGQRIQVYSIGEEIIDPETKQSLGKLEIIKGTGKVVHVQEKIATVSSDMKTTPSKTIRRDPTGLSAFMGSFQSYQEEEILPPITVDFDNPEIGDKVRTI